LTYDRQAPSREAMSYVSLIKYLAVSRLTLDNTFCYAQI